MTDDSDLDLMGAIGRVLPQGPRPADDSAMVATGVVQAVDVGQRLVTVRVRGGVVTLPAVAGRYVMGGIAMVLIDAGAARPIRVIGPVSVRDPLVLATIIAGPTSTIVTVKLDGKEWKIPALPGAYTIGESAWVHLNDWGEPVAAAGPSSTPSKSTDPGGAGSGGAVEIITATTTIGPQSTGTFRLDTGRWDTWGAQTGWGLSDIYQGDGYGSGPLVGLAAYGDQVVNLAALEVKKMTLTARRNRSGSGGSLRVQGSPHGERPSGAPSSSGSTATAGAVSSGQETSVDLPADLCEAFRTGAVKGLCAVGDAYAGFGGTATPGSFTIAITYTRKA